MRSRVLSFVAARSVARAPCSTTLRDAKSGEGAFHVGLPPGSYVIRGCADMAITVAEGSTIHEELSCPVP